VPEFSLLNTWMVAKSLYFKSRALGYYNMYDVLFK